jgi:hypothetical protein
MALIGVEDVIERLDALLAAGAPRTPTGTAVAAPREAAG